MSLFWFTAGAIAMMLFAMRTEKGAIEAAKAQARAEGFESGKRAERAEREINDALQSGQRPVLHVVRGGRA